jgi:hypothetical protein
VTESEVLIETVDGVIKQRYGPSRPGSEVLIEMVDGVIKQRYCRRI